MNPLARLIQQAVTDKHDLGLHAVVSYPVTGAVEVEGFLYRSTAELRAAEPGATRTFHPRTPVTNHIENLGRQVDSEFSPLL